MYCMLFRNKLPRNKDKFAELVMEALQYTFEVGNINREEIVNYMSGVAGVVIAEKADRQITGNITRMILDMGYRWNYAWREDETIQAYEAYEQNWYYVKKKYKLNVDFFNISYFTLLFYSFLPTDSNMPSHIHLVKDIHNDYEFLRYYKMSLYIEKPIYRLDCN